MASHPYQCITLPYDYKSVTQWAPKFIEFRRNSLKIDSSWSVACPELESKITQKEWVSTLSRPAFRVLLCVSTVGKEKNELWQNEWAGMICLYGPLYTFNNLENTLEDRWYLGGGFICPSHRGHNITLDIFQHGLSEIDQEVDLDRWIQSKGNPSRYRTRIQALVDVNYTERIKYFAKTGMKTTTVTTAEEYLPGWNISIGPGQERRKYALLEHVLERESRIFAHL